MSEALLQHIPDRMLELAVRKGAAASQHPWTDRIMYQSLLDMYFPDESESLKPVFDTLDSDQCESMLLHGIGFRYGHLEGTQKEFILSVLSEDYRHQADLLESHPEHCLSTHYVAERQGEEDDAIEFRHVSEIAASKEDSQSLCMMLTAYKQLCEQSSEQDFSGKFFSENYHDIQQENAFLKEPRVKINFINLERIQSELLDMARFESFESMLDTAEADQVTDLKKQKEKIKERRRELAQTLIKGIRAVTQKRFPSDKKYSQREWPFVDFNEFYAHFMANDLGNDHSPKGPTKQ